jgi:hypothetical protein
MFEGTSPCGGINRKSWYDIENEISQNLRLFENPRRSGHPKVQTRFI